MPILTSDLIYIIILGLSKCCTSLFYEQLSAFTDRWMTRGLLGLSITWTLIATFLLAIRCGREPWTDINHDCDSIVSYKVS